MSKPYSHHDPAADRGKAVPQPKRPSPVRSNAAPKWRLFYAVWNLVKDDLGKPHRIRTASEGTVLESRGLKYRVAKGGSLVAVV